MIHPSTSKFREASIDTLSFDSKPKGLMRMAIKNQDMIAWHIPKDKIAGLSDLAVETIRPGIYFLVSDSRIHPNGQPIYVGKATNGAARLRTHLDENVKVFSHAILITGNTDDTLDEASISYLEKAFDDDVKLALKNGYKLFRQNKNTPSETYVKPHNVKVFEEYIGAIKWYLEHLGYNYTDPDLNPAAQSAVITRTPEDSTHLFTRGAHVELKPLPSSDFIEQNEPHFSIKRQKIDKVRGFYDPRDGLFYILPGSVYPLQDGSGISSTVKLIRERLISDNLSTADGEWATTQYMIAFNSPSTASAVMIGNASNGRIDWVTDEGESFADVYAE